MPRAHSDLEIMLDVMMATCDCGGQVKVVGRVLVFHNDVPHYLVNVACDDCGAEAEREYEITTYYDQGDTSEGPLNPGDGPSELLDIVQYSHLARFYLDYVQESVTNLTIEQAGGLLGMGAVCSEEAIKHLRGGKLPPPEAVFSKERQFLMQANPEAFALENLERFRQNIMEYAEHLPRIYDIVEMMTGDPDQDRAILERLSVQYKDDPTLFSQIGRIAKAVFGSDEEDEKHHLH